MENVKIAPNMSKVSWWKRIISFIVEIELERITSDFGYDLSVCLSDGKLQLNANQAIYSWEEKYDNFFQAFEKVNFEKEEIDEVLVLGLGLASIPQILEQQFHCNFNYTGIELDSQVIYLAEKYILHRLKSPVTTIQADAKIFVESSSMRYDLICIDVFVGTKIPKEFLTLSFLHRIKDILNSEGLLMFNHLTNRTFEEKETTDYFYNIFKKVFPRAVIIETGGNYILQNRESINS